MKEPLLKITFTIKPSYGNQTTIALKGYHLYYSNNMGKGYESIGQNANLESELSADEYTYLVGDINDIKISAIPPWVGGLDGTSFELDIKNGFNKTSFIWWGKCPDSWKQLEALANRLTEYVKKYQKE
jgi:hypothetical protein